MNRANSASGLQQKMAASHQTYARFRPDMPNVWLKNQNGASNYRMAYQIIAACQETRVLSYRTWTSEFFAVISISCRRMHCANIESRLGRLLPLRLLRLSQLATALQRHRHFLDTIGRAHRRPQTHLSLVATNHGLVIRTCCPSRAHTQTQGSTCTKIGSWVHQIGRTLLLRIGNDGGSTLRLHQARPTGKLSLATIPC